MNTALQLRIISLAIAAITFAELHGAESSTVIAVDLHNEKIHVAGGSTQIVDGSSIVPIATALTAISWAEAQGQSSSSLVKITEGAAGVASSLGLQSGDSLSFRDILAAIFLAGDQVAINAISAHVGDRLMTASNSRMASIGRFEREMLTTLVGYGCGNTKLKVDPKQGESKTTAKDAMRLLVKAFAMPSFRFYAQQQRRDITILRGNIKLRGEVKNPAMTAMGTAKVAWSTRSSAFVSESRPPDIVKDKDGTSIIYQNRMNVVVLNSKSPTQEAEDLMAQGWQAYSRWCQAGRPLTDMQQLLNPK